jgi:hypothetical protein
MNDDEDDNEEEKKEILPEIDESMTEAGKCES